jgi:hypothetical protein
MRMLSKLTQLITLTLSALAILAMAFLLLAALMIHSRDRL